MPDPTHITVTAPAGRRTPIGRRDGAEPGGSQLCVVRGVVCRVRYSQDVRRSIARGDLIPCDMNGAPVTVTLAAAPSELPGGKLDLAVELSGGGPPAVFGDLPEFDPRNPGPHTSAPKKGSTR